MGRRRRNSPPYSFASWKASLDRTRGYSPSAVLARLMDRFDLFLARCQLASLRRSLRASDTTPPIDPDAKYAAFVKQAKMQYIVKFVDALEAQVAEDLGEVTARLWFEDWRRWVRDWGMWLGGVVPYGKVEGLKGVLRNGRGMERRVAGVRGIKVVTFDADVAEIEVVSFDANEDENEGVSLDANDEENDAVSLRKRC
ncbi:hypothetical protein HDU98_011782 [Podochytrium sp. JEL0797]|nr:hypothetical protein HDU98_011782 [Podochytrium sp. JEL0797]